MAVGTTNTAAFSGDHYAIRGTVGTDLRVSGWVVTPEIGLQYTRVMTDGFAERGGAAALRGRLGQFGDRCAPASAHASPMTTR